MAAHRWRAQLEAQGPSCWNARAVRSRSASAPATLNLRTRASLIARAGPLAFVLLAAVPTLVLGAGGPPPAEAFGSLPLQTHVQLSPNGHWLAWTDNSEAKAHVVMFDLEARKVQRLLQVPESAKIRDLAWNDDETLLTVVSETKVSPDASARSTEYFQLIANDTIGGAGRMLPTAQLIAWRTTKPHKVIMAVRSCKRVIASCLMEVDTRTGEGTFIKVGNEFTVGWVVDRDGRAVARADWDHYKHGYRVLVPSTDAFGEESVREIFRTDDSEPPDLSGLLPDGSALVLLGTNGHSHRAAWALPLDGSRLRLLAEVVDADITETYQDPYSGAIIGVYASGTKTEIQWTDPEARRRSERVHDIFPNRQANVYGWTADGTKTIAEVETPSSPPVYYIVDFSTHRAEIAAEQYPALAGASLGVWQETNYKARDGTLIPAYLTLPPGKPAGSVPLVVLPHGGPSARDFPHFDWLVQFLATRGYAVLQPQFRGSTGFGDAFHEAGYRQWGGLMQDDVTDGVHAMIAQGIADPHRIAIVGASYGGYVALAGAAFTPELYSCAASINGVADLPAMMRSVVPVFGGVVSTSMSAWKAHVGAPNDPNLATKSPINSVKAIKVPVLIAYGTGDGIVPTEQSLRMAHALEVAGKKVTLVKLQGEDHWLSRTETRVHVLQNLESFLKGCL